MKYVHYTCTGMSDAGAQVYDLEYTVNHVGQ